MKLFYILSAKQWYEGYAIDEYKRLTAISRNEAIAAIETQWPVVYLMNYTEAAIAGHEVQS